VEREGSKLIREPLVDLVAVGDTAQAGEVETLQANPRHKEVTEERELALILIFLVEAAVVHLLLVGTHRMVLEGMAALELHHQLLVLP
jgi:hypothetical protein